MRDIIERLADETARFFSRAPLQCRVLLAYPMDSTEELAESLTATGKVHARPVVFENSGFVEIERPQT